MTDPRHATDPLRDLAELSAAMHHGRAAFEQGLSNWTGGYPSVGAGGTGNAAAGGPTAALALTHIRGGVLDAEGNPVEPRKDPAEAERKAYERHITKALEEAGQAWTIYQRTANVRLGVEKLTDPGCELCARIPCGDSKCPCSRMDTHYCDTYATVTVTDQAKRKGENPTERKVKLCSSCYEFNRPDRAGRLRTHAEVIDHALGRRIRRTAS